MQSSSTPPLESPQPVSQHSSPRPSTHIANQQETSQQHIPIISRDTTPIASSKPSTPPSNSQPQPLTPPDSASRSSSATSTGSTLSAAAPQFRTRLIDAPIDLAGLVQPTDGTPPPLQKSTMGSGGSGILDLACGLSPSDDGRTPTQESFPPLYVPSLVAPSPSFSSSSYTPDLSSQSSNGSLSPQTAVAGDGTLRTPNVYINGLPPNFPEDKLLEMTSQYGEVLSVRTFTRHVSEKPSGYGFVLFSSLDAAEKCVESLRKYRNLHPSFSKQIHKIPGTAYANSVALPVSATDPPDSFKVRMERLKDTHSTNLYIEGLPLTIDVPTLQALVSPHKILSSRLFQTRLSNPPRIIAFVRLESRQAAEEIVERLHGRMVRGWNDAGSRISVRFADTAEQRELRRAERMTRDGENSPARLTMAQAALLNLKGTQLHPSSQASRIPSPNFDLSPPMPSDLSLSPDLYAPVNLPELPPPIGLHNQQTLSDLRALGTVHAHRNDGLHSQAADFVSSSLRLPSNAYNTEQAFSPDLLQMQMALSSGITNPLISTRAQNGFTQMERLILQAHETRQQNAERLLRAQQQGLSQGLSSEFSMSASDVHTADARLRGLEAAATASSRGGASRKLMSSLPSMSEADFHATSGSHRQVLRSTANGGASTIAATKQEQKASPLTLDLESRLTFTRQRNQTAAEARAQAQAEAQAQALHTRSTTVPSHYLNNERFDSRSLPNSNSRSINSSIHSTAHSGNAPTQHANLVSVSKDMHQATTARDNCSLLRTANDNFRNNLASTTTVRDDNTQPIHDSSTVKPHFTGAPATSPTNQLHTRIDTALQSRKMSLTRSSVPRVADDEDDGSGLDSPALSYSASVRTPASLSPSTPFSAFGETFEGPPMAPGVKVLGPGGDVALGMGSGVGLAADVKQKMRVTE